MRATYYKKPVAKKAYSKKKNAYVTQSQLKQVISKDIENKYYSFGGQETAVDYNGKVHACSAILPGVGQGQRIARKITLKKLSIAFEVQASSSGVFTSDAYNTVRIILFRWKEDTSAATPTMNDILDSSSNATNWPTTYPYNMSNQIAYKIMWDLVVHVSPLPVYNGSSVVYYNAGPDQSKIVRKDIYGVTLGNKLIHFDNDSNAQGNGHIYMLLVADSAATPDPLVNWAGVLTYEDA